MRAQSSQVVSQIWTASCFLGNFRALFYPSCFLHWPSLRRLDAVLETIRIVTLLFAATPEKLARVAPMEAIFGWRMELSEEHASNAVSNKSLQKDFHCSAFSISKSKSLFRYFITIGNDCSDDQLGCCIGLNCVYKNDFYSQCLPAKENIRVPGPCENNPDSFFYKGKVTSCDALAELGKQKQKRKCREDRRFETECPTICDETCGNSPTATPTNPRGECEDNPESFFWKGRDRSCAEIADLGPLKQERKCRQGRRIENECPSLCKAQCAGNAGIV